MDLPNNVCDNRTQSGIYFASVPFLWKMAMFALEFLPDHYPGMNCSVIKPNYFSSQEQLRAIYLRGMMYMIPMEAWKDFISMSE